MKKIAIIGSGELQTPLIIKAKDLGYETYVFSKKNNSIGENICTNFFEIDVLNVEKILEICQEIGIDGITSIASDITTKAVIYVAEKMKLNGNTFGTFSKATNKYEMRKAFENAGLIIPRNYLIRNKEDIKLLYSLLSYPIIVKPVDRAGSAGVTKVENENDLEKSVEYAMQESLNKQVIVEEYIYGNEYSCECLSINGKHNRLVYTQKFTTGTPNFVEIGHIQPANFSLDKKHIDSIIFKALDVLEVKNGASHTEFKITPDNKIVIIETGARMAGDFIGSDLVKLSTGIDYVEAVIKIAMGITPDIPKIKNLNSCAIKFVCNKKDKKILECIEREKPEVIYSKSNEININSKNVKNSSERFGWFIMNNSNYEFYKRIINS